MIMKLLLCVIFALFSESFVTSEIIIKEYERQSVTIKCSYKWAQSNRKYFCRDPCKEDKDVVVDSINPPPFRYRLQDKGDSFTVNITDLKKTDSGKYWCAVDRMGLDTYTQVILKVLDAPLTSPPPSTEPHIYTSTTLENSSITSKATYTTVINQLTYDNIKTTDSNVYLYVTVGVLLLISLVGTLVYLVLHYKEMLVNLLCTPEKKKASDSEDNSFRYRNSSHNPRPVSTHTLPDYENVLNVTNISHLYSITDN